jgi:hypothetical protein
MYGVSERLYKEAFEREFIAQAFVCTTKSSWCHLKRLSTTPDIAMTQLVYQPACIRLVPAIPDICARGWRNVTIPP